MRYGGPFIATAAWSIPKKVAGRFPETGSGLEFRRLQRRRIQLELLSPSPEEDVPAQGKRGAGAFPFRGKSIMPLEPTHGLETMMARRAVGAARKLRAGPGNLCKALAITGEMNGR
jgi:hypothetical protein